MSLVDLNYTVTDQAESPGAHKEYGGQRYNWNSKTEVQEYFTAWSESRVYCYAKMDIVIHLKIITGMNIDFCIWTLSHTVANPASFGVLKFQIQNKVYCAMSFLVTSEIVILRKLDLEDALICCLSLDLLQSPHVQSLFPLSL